MNDLTTIMHILSCVVLDLEHRPLRIVDVPLKSLEYPGILVSLQEIHAVLEDALGKGDACEESFVASEIVKEFYFVSNKRTESEKCVVAYAIDHQSFDVALGEDNYKVFDWAELEERALSNSDLQRSSEVSSDLEGLSCDIVNTFDQAEEVLSESDYLYYKPECNQAQVSFDERVRVRAYFNYIRTGDSDQKKNYYEALEEERFLAGSSGC